MKFCLRYGHRKNILDQADEIKVSFKDRKILPEIFEKYPDKTIILSLQPRENRIIDWEELKNYNTLSRNKLITEAFESWEILNSINNGIPSYSGLPVTAFHQAKALVHMGVCYLNIDAPLFFQLPQLKELTECPLRITPNLAAKDDLKRENGIYGSWIRPEDLDIYDEYISTYEFNADGLNQEEAIFDIYKNKQKWNVRLDLLITDLDYPALNRLIVKDVIKKRINCGQRCMNGGACRACYRAMMFANENFLLEAQEQIDHN